MPLPLLALAKLAMFAERMAGGQSAAPAAGQATGVVVSSGVVDPVVDRADLVLAHRKTPEWFVRKVVKVRFDATRGVEYIWVKVLATAPGRMLVGTLANTPELADAHMGDVVSFSVKDVADVRAPNRRRRRT